ncbi:MAG TPA: redoxin domain-containing protein [Phycisphaerales bacterium]|nr:redoxin domain-containing protein [Phycisphaerales bacterium]
MKAKALLVIVAAMFAASPVLAQAKKSEEAPKTTQPEKKDEQRKEEKRERKDESKDSQKDTKKDSKDEKDRNPKAAAKVGEKAPDFTATDTNGNTVKLSELTSQGKIVVLQWFNPDCPYVVKHYKKGDTNTFNELHTKYNGKDVVILAVASSAPGKQGSGTERLNKAKTDWNMQYPIVLDESGTIGKSFGAKNTPAMAVIGKDGTLAYWGAIDDDNGPDKPGKTNYVAKALDELIAGKPVTTKETKPYGCSVKYKS